MVKSRLGMRLALSLALSASALLLLSSCAASGRKSLYYQGKLFADVQVASGLVKGEVEGFNNEGRRVYRSRFIGGCEHKPARGHEVVGTKEEWDDDGLPISRWEFSPDSQRAVYIRETRQSKGPGKNNWGSRRVEVYHGGAIDSVLELTPQGDTLSIRVYRGQGCAELRPSMMGFVTPSYSGSLLAAFLDYPETTDEFFHPQTKTVYSRTRRTPDSSNSVTYYPSGKIQSLSLCAYDKEERKERTFCRGGTKTEWHENGRLWAEEKPVSERHEVHRRFYENGNPMTESHYQGTKLDSIYTSWHENGRVHQKILYGMGKELDVKEWDSTGVQTKGNP